jgi:hypothetical protein
VPVKSALNTILRQLLPYPDPWRRRRMRRTARALVTCSPWPGEAASPSDIAQLAMLRLLHLQREAHRSARAGGSEGTMLLARAAIEACISGLYWLDQADAGVRLTNASAKSMKQLLGIMIELFGVPPAGLDDAARLIGEPGDLPKLLWMAKHVASESGVSLTTLLYEQIDMPLSFISEHTTGIALQRHINRDGSLHDTPEQWWTRRRALHTVDLCTGYLAFVLAGRADKDTRNLSAYTEAHARRILTPVVTVFLRYARAAIRARELPKLAREVILLRRASGTYGSLATDDERAAFAKDRVLQAFDQLSLLDDEKLRDGLIEILIEHLIRTDVAETDD